MPGPRQRRQHVAARLSRFAAAAGRGGDHHLEVAMDLAVK